jgi:predicted CXXCH cytochrome family protein
MRRLGLIVAALFLLGLPSLALAGISGTHHDFSGESWNTAQFLCEICHIPHNSGNTRLLWNHTLSSQSFSWDETVTAGGTTLPTNISTWGGTTKNCLSCHDGSVAVGDLFHNGYGSSEFVTGDAQIVSATGDMKGNHPVAIPYPFGQASNTYNSISSGSGVVMTEFASDPTSSGIRLYNDDGSGNVSVGTVTGKTGIECGSCHDPHDNSNDPFLRVSNASSALCLACHLK